MVDTRKTLIYCRESRDDYDANYERIEVQRDILLRFCKRMNLVNIVDIILDDNVSGTSFKRLNGIIERIKNGEIEVIVFKDASRLGRNLRESLNFIAMLEEYGVEILFESEKYDEDFFPLKAWFNEQRAKDDSEKIRRVMRHKMESGDLIVKPVFGYMKKDGKLVPHPEHSKIVKDIFEMFISGMGTSQIATKLNYMGVPTPSQVSGGKKQTTIWNRQHVWRIVNNDTYIGNMTYHKKTNLSYKNKKLVNVRPEDWIVKENHHEAIISQNDFELAKTMAVHSRKTRPDRKKNRPFSGILECGRCHSSLVLRIRHNKKDAYICGKNNREGTIKDHIRENYGCRTHFVLESYLYEAVSVYVKNLLNVESNSAIKIIKQNLDKQETISLIGEYKEKIDSVNRIISKIYDDKLNGLISEGLFQAKYDEYKCKLANYQKVLDEFECDKPRRIPQIELSDILDAIDNHTLSSATVKKLFDKIIFYLPGEITADDKLSYHLSDDSFDYLFKNGGLVFVENISSEVNIVQTNQNIKIAQ